MSDTIAAKCFGCGNVVKVPVSLGGRQAKCPKCAAIMTIPRVGAVDAPLVTDDQLEEVATGDTAVEAEIVEAAAFPPPPVKAAPRALTPAKGTPLRPKSSLHRPVSVKHGSSPRQGRAGARPVAKKSSSGAVIAVSIVLVLLIIVGAVAASRSGTGKTVKPPPATGAPPGGSGPAPDEIDFALQQRCSEYLQAVNRGNLLQAVGFYSYEPGQEMEVRKRVAAILDQGTRYEGAAFRSANAGTGTVIFTCTYSSGGQKTEGKEITISWSKKAENWVIVAGP